MLVAILLLAVLAGAQLECDDDAPEMSARAPDRRPTAGRPATALPPALPPSRGAIRHVSTTGDDAGPGTADLPWRTVQKALDTLTPGERVEVSRGTYTADLVMRRRGTPDAPITVTARAGAPVVLRPASTSGDTYPVRFTDGAAYVRLQGFVIERATGTSSTNVYFEGSAHHIELARNDIRDSQDQGVFAERTTADLRIVANRIHGNGRGHLPDQHQSHGLYLEGRGHLVANNVVYDHPFGFGIQLYPAIRDTIVTNNTVVGSGHSGIVVGGPDGASNIVVRNNILAFNSQYGLESDDACPTETIVEGNVIAGNRSGAVKQVCPGLDTGRGNIEADPAFVSPRLADFTLRPPSPAIDRAQASFSPRTDEVGKTRPQGAGYDIGAHESG